MFVAVLSCIVLVGFAVIFVDRPASNWAHDYLGGPKIFNRFAHVFDPLPVGATLGLAGAAIAAGFGGWKPGEKGRTLISACLAVLISEEIKEQLKQLFGRPWPEKWNSGSASWIGDHAYGFHFFHGGNGWESFPSGHATQMASLAAVIWLRLPRFRWLGVAITSFVAVALWILNYHFVGDIIAGVFLGAACGIGVVAIVCRPHLT
jgi:membrane-associated phospholipid phosphatase